MIAKRVKMTKSCTLAINDCKENIFADCRELLKKNHFTDNEIALFLGQVIDVLYIYREKFGNEKELKYTVRKHFKNIECILVIKGEQVNPFEEGTEFSTKMLAEKALKPLLVNETDQITHIYSAGWNRVTISSPQIHSKSIFSSPMFLSVIIGLLGGLLCLFLPDNIRTLIIDDILGPVFSVCIKIVTGIMVPVIFLSMLSSVSAMQSIEDLTNLGFKIIGRFLICVCSVIVIGVSFMFLFYHSFGVSSVDFEPKHLVELLLDIIPTDIVSPFADGKTPQLVILALFLGAAMLLLGSKGDGLKQIIGQCNSWMLTAMGMVMVICPIFPGVSILQTIANGNAKDLLNGWEFIVASYVLATVCGLLKLIIVSIKYKVSIPILWKKLWPMVKNAFASANNSTIIKLEYDISEHQLGIDKKFSSFWIPMSQAMLNPRQTINMIIPPILILKYTNQPISLAFMVVFILLLIELSIANPGTTGAWTIMFAALTLPIEYVGAFMMYRLLTANYNAAYGALQVGLEQIESAKRFNAIDLDVLRSSPVKKDE